MPRSIVSQEGLPDLGALVEQAPMAAVYCDAELRFIKVNDEFCRFVRLPREAIIGHRVIEVPAAGFDMIMIDRVLTGQVLAGVPLLDWPLEQTIDGVRRVYAWSAFRVADRAGYLGRWAGSSTSPSASGQPPPLSRPVRGSTCSPGPAAISAPRWTSARRARSSPISPFPSSPTGSR